jgi:WD40 repeat protein
VAIWDWTNETEDAALMRKNSPSHEVHNTIKFDSSDNAEICTTGDGSVCFWTWLDSGLDVYSGKVLKADLGSSGGVFTNTVFLPGTGNALTTTKAGSAIFWEGNRGGVQANENRKLRTVSKVIRLVESAINFVETMESGYVVMGCADGAVRFYDHSLRLEAWYEDLMAGPVNSCSFSVQQCPLSEAGKPGSKFWAPDFMVGTTDAFIVGVEALCFEEVNPDDRRGTLLMQGLTDYISNVACHPTRSLVAFASYNGSLQIWDYDMKLLMNLREFNPRGASANPTANTAAARLEASNFLRPVTVAFEPRGDFVAVGFTSGHVKFLDVNTFEDISSFAPSTDSVFGLEFSPSGDYLTCYDDSNHVLLFKRTSKIDPSTMGDEVSNPNNSIFTYLGRVHSHARKITGLQFGMRDGMENLVSVAEDRQCVEYDIDGSTVIGGVTPLAEPRPPALDLNAFPSALMWAPAVPGVEGEDRFIVANDEFKIKEYNLDSKQCRKTAISPTYGGPLNCMLPLTQGGFTKHYAYSTGSKVIGIGTLPITGNPRDAIGIVAHPDVVSSIAVSHDGNYIFSCGGNDLSVNMWQVDTSDLVPVNERNDAGKAEMEAFIELLDGGENGPLHSDIKDYFYYCQLRTQGEGSMAKRAITGKIPVTEVPSLARAVGFYPSEEEVANMIAEVRYSTFMDTGRLEEEIDMGDFIKLYVNHRPVLPLNNAQILSAFETVAKR